TGSTAAETTDPGAPDTGSTPAESTEGELAAAAPAAIRPPAEATETGPPLVAGEPFLERPRTEIRRRRGGEGPRAPAPAEAR
ncbi:hypothetical protein DF186_22710, partial [Enterococcus hirae]